MLWDNDKVFSHKWQNQHLIDCCIRVYEDDVKGKGPNGEDRFVKLNGNEALGDDATYFAWHIIADILRYEILYEYGGYMPGADSVCLRNIDDKFPDDIELYTLRTGAVHEKRYYQRLAEYKEKSIDINKLDPGSREYRILQRLKPYNASPILAARKGNKFMRKLVEELGKLKSEDLGEAVDTTGNVFMGKMIQRYRPDRMLILDYTLRKDRLANNDYSMHYAGTTKGTYNLGR